MVITPVSLGYRMPAEWEPHEATWMAWPYNKRDWPGKFDPIPWVFAEIARKIAPGEKLRIFVKGRQQQLLAARMLRQVGVDLSGTKFIHLPINRGWTRDSGPIFVKGPSSVKVAIVRFRFNAWAKYKSHLYDSAIPERVAKLFGFPLFRAKIGEEDFVLEGGSIDVNGRGSLLATEECLLDTTVQVRNPGFGRKEVERALREHLGVKNILWLGRGIVGDDTHGHVDDVCRFVAPRTVVLCQEKNPNDPNYHILEENRERLQEMRTEDGYRIEVVPIPMPSPVIFNRMRLPASYANFYIANAAVLVPTFNDPNDRIALGILSELFKDRPVVGIHAVDLVWGLGTIHCVTQQQPAK